MAAIAAATPIIAGSALPLRTARRSSRAATLKSSFTGKVAVSVRPVRAAASKKVTTMAFDDDWLKKDPLVFVLGFLGWTVPSTIGVPAFGGNSLFGLLLGSIGENMAKFPTGPALDDKFWLYMITWHIGLFTTMLLGQVGFQGKKTGYW